MSQPNCFCGSSDYTMVGGFRKCSACGRLRVNVPTQAQINYSEKKRIDEEFDDWMQEQGIGDHQLPEVDRMLDDMIASQKLLYKGE